MQKYDFKRSRLHLFPTPTIWTGIGSLIDVYGVLNTYNAAPSGAKADYDAIRSDWLAVGDDIAEAIKMQKEMIESASVSGERAANQSPDDDNPLEYIPPEANSRTDGDASFFYSRKGR